MTFAINVLFHLCQLNRDLPSIYLLFLSERMIDLSINVLLYLSAIDVLFHLSEHIRD